MSLEQEDAAAAAVATAPRVTLEAMKAKIAAVYHFTAAEAVAGIAAPVHPALPLLSICILVMQNGFTIIGQSAPASPENFNAELGRKIALDDALRQLWPLEGYELRSRLALQTDPGQGVPALPPLSGAEPAELGVSTAGVADETGRLQQDEEKDGPGALELGAAARAAGPDSY